MDGVWRLQTAQSRKPSCPAMINKEHNKSLGSPLCHEGFGITDKISQVIAKLSENGSNISTEVMEVRATLELPGNLKALDH